jgi:uncharacterized protein YecE (DUF72 family)
MKAMWRVGTSGWVYQGWRGVFYPEDLPQSRWFAHYAQSFDTTEINYSFYRLPSEAAVGHWRQQAPAGFSYSIKANRFLTHVRRLKDLGESLEKFLSRVSRLDGTLGPILWQLPPKFPPDPVRLEAFAGLLPAGITHAFEFRDRRWFVPSVREVLERSNLSFCIFDMPDFTCPLWVTSETVYLRFHGSQVIYGSLYGVEGLEKWADHIQRWCADGRNVFAYFNNDALGYAVEDARTLKRLLGEAQPPKAGDP